MGKYWLRCLGIRMLYRWHSPKRVLKRLLPIIRLVAREYGYAIAVHGSVKRDIDLVAIPWIDDAQSAEELIEAIENKIGWFHVSQDSPMAKPHGRKAWSIVTHGARTYIDLSVMPRKEVSI